MIKVFLQRDRRVLPDQIKVLTKLAVHGVTLPRWVGCVLKYRDRSVRHPGSPKMVLLNEAGVVDIAEEHHRRDPVEVALERNAAASSLALQLLQRQGGTPHVGLKPTGLGLVTASFGV